MSSPKILAFPKGLPAKPQYGEQLRLRIVRGKPANAAYCLLAESVLIGRDDSCDIVIDDNRASRRHVNLVWQKDHYVAQDLGSVNGFLVNGKRVKNAKLDPGDVLTVGDTEIEVVEVGKVQALRSSKKSPEQKKKDAQQKKNKNLVLFGVLMILYVAFSPDENAKTIRGSVSHSFVEEPVRKPRLKKKDANLLIQETLPDYVPETDQEKSANRFFLAGRREYSARNFRRAITAFETALTIDADHELAKVYLKLSKRDLESELTSNFVSAKRAYKAFRWDEAKMYLDNIKKLLEAEPDHPSYKKAEELIGDIEKLEGKQR